MKTAHGHLTNTLWLNLYRVELHSPVSYRGKVPLWASVHPLQVSWSEPNEKQHISCGHCCLLTDTEKTIRIVTHVWPPTVVLWTHCWIHVFINSRVRPDTLHSAGETQSRDLRGILIYDTMYSKRERHSVWYHIFCSLLFLQSVQPHHRCWPRAQCCSFVLQEWTDASWLTSPSAQQDLAKQIQIQGLAVSPSESLSACVSLLCLKGTCSLPRSARARMVCSKNDKERLMYTASFNVCPFDWKVNVTLMKKNDIMTY